MSSPRSKKSDSWSSGRRPALGPVVVRRRFAVILFLVVGVAYLLSQVAWVRVERRRSRRHVEATRASTWASENAFSRMRPADRAARRVAESFAALAVAPRARPRSPIATVSSPGGDADRIALDATTTTAATPEAGPIAEEAELPGALAGVVLDTDGAPIPGATVRVLAGGRRFHQAKADAFGRFDLAEVAAGRYVVAARAAGFRESRVRGRVDLAPGQERGDLVIELPLAGAITGRVLDGRRHPIRGARVRVHYRGAFGVIQARTNAEGRYRVLGAHPGRNRVSVVHPGFLAPRSKVVRVRAAQDGTPAPLRGVNFVMRRGGGIRGVVIGTEGEPLSTAVEVRDRRNRRIRRTRSSEGLFSVWGLARGSYRLRAGTPAEGVAVRSVRVPSSGMADVTLEVQTEGVISGRVLNANGSPLSRVLVRADRLGVWTRAEVRTGQAGVFQIDGLPDGDYRVRAVPPDLYREPPAQRARVSAGLGPLELTFRVTAGAVVEGQVLAADGGPAGGAYVSLYDDRGHRMVGLRSDPAGRFRAPRVAIGALSIFAALGDEVARDRVYTNEGEDNPPVRVYLHRMGEARGRVFDANGRPRRRQRVVCVSLDPTRVTRRVGTDGRGRYRITHLYPGRYRVTAGRGASVISKTIIIDRGTRLQDIDLTLR